MAYITTVVVPDIGDFDAVDVAEVLVAVNDDVAQDDPLITLESDKATMDVPSPEAGRVAELLVEVGSTVSQGDPILKLEVSERKAPQVEPPVEKVAELAKASENTEEDAGDKEVAFSDYIHAGPGVRRLARELGVELRQVRGTGRKGRITRENVTEWVKNQLTNSEGVTFGAGIPPMPEVDFSQFGPIETVNLSKIRRVAAENLHRAWLHVPHVTHHDEADITDLEEFRQSHAKEAEKQGFKLTPLAFILKACVVALRQFPDFNSSLSPDGQSLIRKGYYHFGIAVDTPNGLVVPVIRDVDTKSIFELARELAELGHRTRERKVTPEDLRGASFSVSNLGGLGGTAFTPIVNAPEVAILGVSRTQRKPLWNPAAETFEPRLMLPLSLSYDHRVIDGAAAARFVTLLVRLLSDIRRLVL